MSQFVLVDSADKPRGGWGGYRRIAVLEVEDGYLPKKIALTKGVLRIVQTWESLSSRGKASRYHFALEEARRLIAHLEEPLLRLADIKELPNDR